MNSALAKHTLSQAFAAGVRELCICPGARNAPWIQWLKSSRHAFEVRWFFEERSAAFFALGRIRESGRPVAVLTTSGTAVGELLPATMEAFYARLPLVLMTADRPRRFRGTGAPQAAEQRDLFGRYAVRAFDLANDETFTLSLTEPGPVQVNVCFEDPKGPSNLAIPEDRALTRASSDALPLRALLREARFPFVIVGQLEARERPAVEAFLARLNAPTYFEALSGLRERERLHLIRIHSADQVLERAKDCGYPIDGVIRLGGIPTHRVWRDLEDRAAAIPVVSVSALPFSGLARSSALCVGELATLLTREERFEVRGVSFLEQDRACASALVRLLREEPHSEAGLLHRMSEEIEPGSRVFLGNSLPIREWDLAATFKDRGYEITASRGLNGIDGQVSSFLGFAREGVSNWGLVGDLTALYDLAGVWPLVQPGSRIDARIVVINNGGGKIFDRMFAEKEFQNPHTLNFAPWAALWGLEHRELREIPRGLAAATPGRAILEVKPDPEATARFWQKHASALR